VAKEESIKVSTAETALEKWRNSGFGYGNCGEDSSTCRATLQGRPVWRASPWAGGCEALFLAASRTHTEAPGFGPYLAPHNLPDQATPDRPQTLGR
jgi:hypothetical protein